MSISIIPDRSALSAENYAREVWNLCATRNLRDVFEVLQLKKQLAATTFIFELQISLSSWAQENPVVRRARHLAYEVKRFVGSDNEANYWSNLAYVRRHIWEQYMGVKRAIWNQKEAIELERKLQGTNIIQFPQNRRLTK